MEFALHVSRKPDHLWGSLKLDEATVGKIGWIELSGFVLVVFFLALEKGCQAGRHKNKRSLWAQKTTPSTTRSCMPFTDPRAGPELLLGGGSREQICSRRAIEGSGSFPQAAYGNGIAPGNGPGAVCGPTCRLRRET